MNIISTFVQDRSKRKEQWLGNYSQSPQKIRKAMRLSKIDLSIWIISLISDHGLINPIIVPINQSGIQKAGSNKSFTCHLKN